MPNIVLVYPQFPLLSWEFQFAMDFMDRKACVRRLGGNGDGAKESGYGRELLYYGIKEFMNIKTVFVK